MWSVWLVLCDCGFHSVCPLSFKISSALFIQSLIHFEFIFVYFVKKKSSGIVFLVAVQFFQHCLLKRLSFPHWIFFPPLLKMNRPYKHGNFPGSLFCSIDLCVFLPSPYGLTTVVVQDSLKLESWYPSSALLSQDCLAIWDVLWSRTICRIIASSFVKNAMNGIESVESLGHFNNTTNCNAYFLHL